jgi:outer membrane protein TolC
MKRNVARFLLAATAFFAGIAAAQDTSNTAPAARQIKLQEAVQLALKHNHDIRIAGYTVEEKQHAKEVAKSAYFPSIRNDSTFMHATETELIQIKAGSLGASLPPASTGERDPQPRWQKFYDQRNPDHPAVDEFAQDQTSKRSGSSRIDCDAGKGRAY